MSKATVHATLAQALTQRHQRIHVGDIDPWLDFEATGREIAPIAEAGSDGAVTALMIVAYERGANATIRTGYEDAEHEIPPDGVGYHTLSMGYGEDAIR